ncbi:hypothetical protein ACE6H2_005979 [Prunus campanulata]
MLMDLRETIQSDAAMDHIIPGRERRGALRRHRYHRKLMAEWSIELSICNELMSFRLVRHIVIFCETRPCAKAKRSSLSRSLSKERGSRIPIPN